MRDSIFNSIMTAFRACTKFIGEDGTVRVYDYPVTSPVGYPYAVVSSTSLESKVLDNASDVRQYFFKLQIVGEKFGEQGGMTQSEALGAMRTTEDAVLAILDANNDLDNSSIIRVMPTSAVYGTADGNSRIVLTIEISADTRPLISY